MTDNLLLAKQIKKTILYIDKIIINYPKVEQVLINNIRDKSYELLELVYLANESINRKTYQKKAIVNLKLIDFYFKISVNKGCISYKKYEKIGTYLIDIVKQLRSWMKCETSQ